MNTTFTLPVWLECATESLRAGNIEGWMEIYSPSAIHEFPFAPEGAPRILTGHDAIKKFMSQLPSLIQFGKFDNVRASESGDQVVVEAVGHHLRKLDNKEIDLTYVWIVSMKNGKVEHFRDYMNPFEIQKIFSESES